MSLQQIIGWFFLVCAILYAIYIIKEIIKDRDAFKAQPGDLRKLLPSEFLVYVLATIGISDFVMNTIVIKKFRLADAESVPDTLITSGIVPGSVLAVVYLMKAGYVDPVMIIIMMAGLMISSYLGALAVGHMEGKFIKKAMVTMLVILLAVLIIKNQIAGQPGDLTTLSGVKLVILAVSTLILGFVNMLGIPTKPFFTTIFLMLGLSPIATLALLLGTIPISVIAGGINVVKRRRYNSKLALSALSAGSLGAIIGCSLTITINQNILNILLIIVIMTAIVSLIKK